MTENKQRATSKKKKKTFTKKQKGSSKEVAAPAKKRGRPSNAELAERAKIKRHEHDAVREQLLAAMESSVTIPVATNIPKSDSQTAAPVLGKPKYPVFFIGEQVCMGWWENLYEGHVICDPDPINGALARVNWDDGRISWHAKENLRSIHKAKQRKVKRVIYGDQQRVSRNLENTSSID